MFVNDVTSMIKNKKQNGFTLIEVMIVVVIVAILAAVAMTSYQGSIPQNLSLQRLRPLTTTSTIYRALLHNPYDVPWGGNIRANMRSQRQS